MRKALVIFGACVTLLAIPQHAFAWGFVAHRLIMRRAIDLLPPQIKPWFEAHRDELVVRVVDPDMWRNVGWEEDPNHFVDYGVPEYGKYPFTELPRDYDKALEKFGIETLKRNGMLPWRTNEVFGYLRRTFAELPRNAPYTLSN